MMPPPSPNRKAPAGHEYRVTYRRAGWAHTKSRRFDRRADAEAFRTKLLGATTGRWPPVVAVELDRRPVGRWEPAPARPTIDDLERYLLDLAIVMPDAVDPVARRVVSYPWLDPWRAAVWTVARNRRAWGDQLDYAAVAEDLRGHPASAGGEDIHRLYALPAGDLAGTIPGSSPTERARWCVRHLLADARARQPRGVAA